MTVGCTADGGAAEAGPGWGSYPRPGLRARRLRGSGTAPGALFADSPDSMDDPRPTPPDTLQFRSVMGAFPTGVAVVTARRNDGAPVGLTANSLTSVSLDPLLVLVCIDHKSASHEAIVSSGAFAVNLLAEEGRGLSDTFARGDREDRFQDVAWRTEVTGSPVLEEALGWLDCRIHQTHVAGDHTIVVGRVEACRAGDAEPLIYHRGRYREMAPP